MHVRLEQVGAVDVRGSHFKRRRTNTFMAHLIGLNGSCISNLSSNRSEWDALDDITTDTTLTLQRWMTGEPLPLKSDTLSPSLSHATTRVARTWETL